MPRIPQSAALAGALVLAACAAAGLLAAGAAPEARAEEPWRARNLKVLPKDIAKPDIEKIMKTQAKALGVECDYCHNVPHWDEDTKHKETARKMIGMVREINGQWFDGKPKVECMTCHRGKTEPAGGGHAH